MQIFFCILRTSNYICKVGVNPIALEFCLRFNAGSRVESIYTGLHVKFVTKFPLCVLRRCFQRYLQPDNESCTL